MPSRRSQVSRCGQVTILNTVNTRLPFLPADEKMDVKEEVRLKTRVLDLRCGCSCHQYSVQCPTSSHPWIFEPHASGYPST